MTDFEALLRALHAEGVDFILVGGVAARAHGSARLTQDLDIVYRRAPQGPRGHRGTRGAERGTGPLALKG